ncbi:MAG: Gfo/Idh/MocA family oxidoreductase [Thermoguttaceae bacterium]|nr:Gfo/Idh/MocA family oxidoreductase [Thermoguttaceae bacterium]MDW8077981.1 Gfo/Idh/MocA family oxidoreductase [Thermoguttaceae bacterium]
MSRGQRFSNRSWQEGQHRRARDANQPATDRRDFLATGGKMTLGVSLAAGVLPAVHAGEENTIRLALIGCGGRGSGAVRDAFSVATRPIELYAMADIFSDRLQASHANLSKLFPKQVNCPPERQFVGFDSYKHAIDCLRPGDIAMLTGYAAFRPMQLEYAVAKGVNAFLEKSFATDPPGIRRLLAAAKIASEKNLKVAAGLQCRHSVNRHELIRRIREGELGDILMVRAYRMEYVGAMGPKPPQEKELFWQIRNFFRFYWVSGGLFAEMDIHQIDEICWLFDQWPIDAHGVGGRSVGNTDPSQNLDSYCVEWTFPSGGKGFDVVRYLPNCHTEFATFVHGTKRAAQFSGRIHAGTVRIYKDQRIDKDNILWEAPEEKLTPWQAEWADLLEAIEKDLPYNEMERAAYANLATIMGRAAVHMGRIITWQEALQSNFQWCASIDQMNEDTPPPVLPSETGQYPVPEPGKWVEI